MICSQRTSDFCASCVKTRLDLRLVDASRGTSFNAAARAAFHVLAPGETLVWNWHLDAICYDLELVLRGETTRLIIDVPPRSLMSFLVSLPVPHSAWAVIRPHRSSLPATRSKPTFSLPSMAAGILPAP